MSGSEAPGEDGLPAELLRQCLDAWQDRVWAWLATAAWVVAAIKIWVGLGASSKVFNCSKVHSSVLLSWAF